MSATARDGQAPAGGEGLIVLARSRVTHALTTEECQQYLHVDACPERP